MRRVLITGSAGRLGRAAVAELTARGHTVIGFDRVPTPGLPREQAVVGTLDDPDRLMGLAKGLDCLIHLAATPDDAEFPRQSDFDNFESELVPNNVVGPYRVMEVVRQAGVPRVVLASSGQVIDGHLRAGRIPVSTTVPTMPRYLYACTKAFLEGLGQVYSRHHGIRIIVARLGWCPRDAGQVAEIRASELAQDVFLSPGDAGRFFAAAVEAEDVPSYSALFVTSRFTHKLRYDLNPTRDVLGWEPREQWPAGAEAW
ncbi:MAG TPA: NAD(P)-dependent oxidoreductase [Fimbriiglobus sp.]|jgi:nucleoside-diphosphate-sugar epimerase